MIGYSPPPLPEQPIPQAPHIPLSLFRRVASSMRPGTGRRGFSSVSSVAALGKAQARRAREGRSERRAEQSAKIQRTAARAQQQKARAEEVGGVAEAIGKVAATPRRKRGQTRRGQQPPSPLQARNVPGKPKQPQQPKQPPVQPAQPKQPAQKKKKGKTKKAFQHAGLGPQGKSFLTPTKKQQKHALPGGPRRENPRNPAITTPLHQPAAMQSKEEPLQDMADIVYKDKAEIDVAEVGQRASTPENQARLDELMKQKEKRSEEIMRLQMEELGMSPEEQKEAIKGYLGREINTPQEYNLLHDISDLFGKEQVTLIRPMEGQATGELPKPLEVNVPGPRWSRLGPATGLPGNVSEEDFKSDIKSLIETYEHDAENYEKNMAGDIPSEYRAFELRRNAQNLRALLARHESEKE